MFDINGLLESELVKVRLQKIELQKTILEQFALAQGDEILEFLENNEIAYSLEWVYFFNNNVPYRWRRVPPKGGVK